jgi:hypothetical protein
LTDTIIKMKAALNLKTSKDEAFHPDLVKAITEVWRQMKVYQSTQGHPHEGRSGSVGQMKQIRAENPFRGSQADVHTLRPS